jgi:hypothetical protein
MSSTVLDASLEAERFMCERRNPPPLRQETIPRNNSERIFPLRRGLGFASHPTSTGCNTHVKQHKEEAATRDRIQNEDEEYRWVECFMGVDDGRSKQTRTVDVDDGG